jgi:cytochrome b561
MKRDARSKLSTNTLMLHWIVAVMMIGLLGSGLYMTQTEFRPLYPWHKSFGVIIVLFVLLRIAWRFKNGWPKSVREYRPFEKWLSKAVHYLLIFGTVVMPLSGFLMSALGGHGVSLFSWELVARNTSSVNPADAVPINGALAGIAHEVHWIAGYILIAAVGLHVVGALKHHLVDKDGTLRRMLGAEVQ